jgi:tRNA (guanine-N7-)-methyltransferase
MSKRNKLMKFADILRYPNVVENYDPRNPRLVGEMGLEVQRKGQWAKEQFGNEHPITLELACGRGEYTLQLARRYTQRNFIGVDIKGARIWKGSTIALEEGLQNVAFLRTRIEQLDLFFAPGEIQEIWITFPDPFPAKENRRLTAPAFLDRYRCILEPGGILHFKTDDTDLFDYSLEVLQNDPQVNILYQNHDIYAGEELYLPELAFKTYYEAMHLANRKKIKYLQCTIH